MKAFDFDTELTESYANFSRSFTKIRSGDLKERIDQAYDDGHFWPSSLFSLNPRYETGPSVDELVEQGELDAATGQIFRIQNQRFRLHRHQTQALCKAKSEQRFVVTTGTGSGKSLCFFIPIVDAIVRALRAGETRRTRAIIIYPMNALANSQEKEIKKFIDQSGLPQELKPVIRRYTGQESSEARDEIANQPPDILLTNFMMAELLLTRQEARDMKVIQHASSLEFLVLDELHTYRGRQGADVAVLIRRLRDRCVQGASPLCIGTSATMSSEGSEEDRATAVAEVASKLFGCSIGREAVIDESLRRSTDPHLTLPQITSRLAEVITQPIPDLLTDEALHHHPLAVWTELRIGLTDTLVLRRQKPRSFDEVVQTLSVDSGINFDTCKTALMAFLSKASLPENERGGEGEYAFLAFKLHRFISGAAELYTSLAPRPRPVILDGQLQDPDHPEHQLYPTRFCRHCGHEFHLVRRKLNGNTLCFGIRSIDDVPVKSEDDLQTGFLTPAQRSDDLEYIYDGSIDTLPEDWRENRGGNEIVKSGYQNRVPINVYVNTRGELDPMGQSFWFIPGRFSFCPCCLHYPIPQMRDRTKS